MRGFYRDDIFLPVALVMKFPARFMRLHIGVKQAGYLKYFLESEHY